MANTFVKYPKVGDHCVGDLSTGKQRFISAADFDLSELDKTKYEILGVVFWRKGNRVKIVAPTDSSRRWITYYEWQLNGLTADGAEHSFTLGYRHASNSWGANLTAEIKYKGTDNASVAASIDAALQKVDNLVSQKWHCHVVDGVVKIACYYSSWQQASYNTATSGASMVHAFMPNIPADSNMLRYNGQYSGEGAVHNLDRAIAYYTNDNDSTAHNPKTLPANLRTAYPVCLPCYLGTSKYNDNSVEKCAPLRAIYGEGKEGWKNYMKSTMVVLGVDRGSAKEYDGLARTKAIVANKDYDGNIACPAAAFAYNYSKKTIPAGSWWLPTPNELGEIYRCIHYPIEPTDVINESLLKQGSTRISNSIFHWSCGRYSAGYAWCGYGLTGYLTNSNMYNTYAVRPLALIVIND